MALVRRSELSAAVPRPRLGYDGAEAPTTTIDGDEPTARLGVGTADEAAAAPSRPARWIAVLGALVFAGAGTAGARMLGQELDTQPLRVGGDMSTWAGLLVFAAAVERVLEPITRWMPGRKAREAYEQVAAALTNGQPGVSMAHVAAAKARCDQHRADRTVLAWGLATGLATLLAAGGGFYLLRMIAEDSAWAGLPAWIDALVTGLVVGSGTKPLHDLVSRAQR